MREERKRKALYVNRREDLYAEALIRKERAAGKTAGKGRPKPILRPGGELERAKPTR